MNKNSKGKKQFAPLAQVADQVRDFLGQFGVAWRLFWDGRVSLPSKIVPVLTIAYVLLPLDLLPDMALGLGQLDDLAILMFGMRLFIELAPRAVVQEYTAGADGPAWRPDEGPVIDLDGEVIVDDKRWDEEEEVQA
jgi:uncharacterized membrane protein YkvA (DUF1232 family)